MKLNFSVFSPDKTKFISIAFHNYPMDRVYKGFLIIFIFLISITLPHTKEIHKEVSDSGLDSQKEIEPELNSAEDLQPLKSTKDPSTEPKSQEDKPIKSFSIDDLIELAKKHRTQHPARPAVKKMEYVEEKIPPSAPQTSAYQARKGYPRKYFMPIDCLPSDHYTFAIQFICSKPFIQALSCLISGQKNLTTIYLENKDITLQEKITSLCNHLKLGKSIIFLYLPEKSQHKIFGLHLSRLIQNASSRQTYSKRGLSKYTSPSKWTNTISNLPSDKKVVRQCACENTSCTPLSLKIENSITYAVNQQQSNPLEAFRDLFDHGNGTCSVKHLRLTIAQQEKNL